MESDPDRSGRASGVSVRRDRRDAVALRSTRFDTARHRCDLRSRSGTTATIWSTHYLSIGAFEDRGASYAALVRTPASKVAQANPQCRFENGKRAAVYWAEHGFLAAMVLILVALFTVIGGASGPFVWARLLLLLCWVPLMIRYTRKNRPRRFDPANMPDALLPDTAIRPASV